MRSNGKKGMEKITKSYDDINGSSFVAMQCKYKIT